MTRTTSTHPSEWRTESIEPIPQAVSRTESSKPTNHRQLSRGISSASQQGVKVMREVVGGVDTDYRSNR
eukprot:4690695-Alexandrium_andersonii.AAC.1